MNMLELENYLPYLVNRTGQRFVAAFTPSLAMMEVDVQMWRVMSVLYVKGDQSAGELSALTSINLSTLSRLAGRMTEKGLIRRQRGGEDARSVIVVLTDKGREATEALIPKAAALEASATKGLTDTEIATLKGLLIRLYRGIAMEE